ncbi:hypothetical protein CAJAP_02276 [Camponotus japonicus]
MYRSDVDLRRSGQRKILFTGGSYGTDTISVIGREDATQLRKSHEWRRLVSVDPMKIHTVRLTAAVVLR